MGTSMMRPWGIHGASMVPPWCIDGTYIVIPLEAWFIHGTLTVFQWLCFHGAPWCVHEIAINLTTMRKRPTMVPAEILQNTVAVAKNSRWWALYLSSTVCGGRWWTVVLFLLSYRHQPDSAVTRRLRYLGVATGILLPSYMTHTITSGKKTNQTRNSCC